MLASRASRLLRQIPVTNFTRASPNVVAANFATEAPAAKKSTKLWGGRFSKDVDQSILGWTESITVDSHLVAEDVWGSMAHVSMLGSQGIIPHQAAAAILPTLLKFQNEFNSGEWKLGNEQEDVHMNVEARLIKEVGMDFGGRMHTCRSRNDQVVLDSKLYARRRILELRERLVKAIDAILTRAAKHTEDVMVSYTHVQHAQPVSVAFWLSHYGAVMLRDLERLKRAYDVTDQNPLGAGAIAGTSFPIDRELTTKLLGFQKVHPHSLDATSARDFMLETVSAVATLESTLSRLAEELILWSSYEFRAITLDDGFAMGSSMMPQKKNPGVLELLRGRAGRLNGLLVAAFTLMKGLPSGYNRDFHEDKEILVESLSLINRAVEVIPALIQSTTLNFDRMADLAFENFATATELANYLVLKHNVPFREAHHVVGSLVGQLSRAKENFRNFDACYEHIVKTHKIDAPKEDLQRVLDPKSVMMSYNSLGGTGPDAVNTMLKQFREELANHKQVLDADNARVANALEFTRNLAAQAANTKSADELKKLAHKH
jgi:argininosuccinate lyase